MFPLHSKVLENVLNQTDDIWLVHWDSCDPSGSPLHLMEGRCSSLSTQGSFPGDTLISTWAPWKAGGIKIQLEVPLIRLTDIREKVWLSAGRYDVKAALHHDTHTKDSSPFGESAEEVRRKRCLARMNAIKSQLPKSHAKIGDSSCLFFIFGTSLGCPSRINNQPHRACHSLTARLLTKKQTFCFP